MRYFFHLVSDTNVLIDHRGKEVSNLKAMKRQAADLARARAEDGMSEGWSVQVVDAHNREVLRLPFSEAITCA